MSEAQRDAAIKRVRAKRAFTQNLVAYVAINLFLIGIWAVSGAGYFWPIWVILGWGIGVVMHGYAVYGRKGISETDIQREIDRRGDIVE